VSKLLRAYRARMGRQMVQAGRVLEDVMAADTIPTALVRSPTAIVARGRIYASPLTDTPAGHRQRHTSAYLHQAPFEPREQRVALDADFQARS
jgi:hypothetical protein